ncbi:L-seryl-tRNA(Sec) kinase isoform X3 [Hyperolius riggenbachi]|uniref:L-seryl-tRNA(Sec) kinase isoform X3 n=1 Tax=Hyperolius riggenbachi TaxID=752182 RepID=UPI0035A327B6
MEEPRRKRPMGLCLLCGLPGAGKSTLAAALREKHSRYTIAVISYDAILAEDAFEREPAAESREISCQPEEMGGKEQSAWKKYRQHLLQCLEQLTLSLISGCALQAPDGNIASSWERFCRCLEHQGLISAASLDSAPIMNPAHRPLYLLLDDNFYYQSMRYEVYQLARKYCLGFCQLYLQCPAELCLQRNRSRHSAVTEETILLMEGKIEPPNAERNSWEENSLILDGRTGVTTDKANITSLLQRALDNPVRPLEDDSEEKGQFLHRMLE